MANADHFCVACAKQNRRVLGTRGFPPWPEIATHRIVVWGKVWSCPDHHAEVERRSRDAATAQAEAARPLRPDPELCRPAQAAAGDGGLPTQGVLI
jgi:hypothetical protein